jgi:hypothetical protein
MGHLSPKTTYDHYIALASKKDAARFWEISRPADSTGKVIHITARQPVESTDAPLAAVAITNDL